MTSLKNSCYIFQDAPSIAVLHLVQKMPLTLTFIRRHMTSGKCLDIPILDNSEILVPSPGLTQLCN